MKKFFTLVAVVALTALSLISSKSYASHAVGADVTYQYVGPNQYLVTVRFYRDCSGIPAPPSVDILYASSCFAGGSVTLNLLPGSGTQIPPSACLPIVTTTCNGGTGYGVEEYIYQGLVTIGGPCADWTFTFDTCCRNVLITTLPNPGSDDIYVASGLDNINFPINSSPVFANIPVTQFCVGNQFLYNQGATDADGDSLVFSLVAPSGFGGTPLLYVAPYGPLQPVASSTPITIDPQTGTISFTPSMIQVGVIAVLVEEFRNGIKIGQVVRDIQMNIVGGCIGQAPVFSPTVDPLGNPAPYYTANCGDNSLYLVLQDPIQCGSVVPTDIRILTPQGQLNPVLTATPVTCVNGVADSILVTFFYPLTVGTTYAFTKVGFDNNTFLSECGVQMPEFDSIPFNVTDPGIFNMDTMDVSCSFDNITLTFDYEIVCNTLTQTGTEFFLVDANNVTYPVTAISNCPGGNGYSSTLTFNFGSTISPATPLYLIVQNGLDANTFTNRCNTYIPAGDTLAILNVLNNLIVNLGIDQTICDSDPSPVLDAGLSGLSYVWTLNGTTLPDITQTIVASQSGTYTVAVNASASCFGGDSIQVTIIPGPVVSLGADTTICASDVLILDAGNPGATYLWSTGEVTQTIQPLTSGNYTVLVSNGGQCTNTGSINVTIVQALTVAVADQAICSDQPFPVLDAGVSGVNYSWTLNGNVVGTNQTYQPTQSGNYQITVSIGNCNATDNAVVDVVAVPVVSLSNVVVCPGAPFPSLDAGNPGATYQWNSGQTSQTIIPNAAGAYVVTVTNTASGISCSASASSIVSNSNPVVVTLGNDIVICDGTGSQVFDAGNAGSSYVWTYNGAVITGQTNQTISTAIGGTYEVTVTDANGCTGNDIILLSVNTNPTPNIGADLQVCPGDAFPVLNGTINNANTYNWTLNGATVGNNATYTPGDYGTYMLTATDLNGCVGTDEIAVTEAPCEIVIPNVFTPGNGDGLNDVFFIKNLDSNPNTSIIIFNRWGNEVYSSGNYQNNWNGGTLPDGTYFYTLKLQTGKKYNGQLKLIRKD